MSLSYWAKQSLSSNWRNGYRADKREQSQRKRERRTLIEETEERPLTHEDQSEHRSQRKPPSTRAETAIAWLTLALAIVAAITVIVNVAQWTLGSNQLSLARDQFNFARNEAADTANGAAASLNVSQRVAGATADQASAMKQMAGAAERQATAAAAQAKAATAQLGLSQAPNIDLVIEPRPYGDFGPFEATATISNHGTYTVRAKIFARTMLLSTKDTPNIWNHLLFARTIDVVPGMPHVQPFGAPVRIFGGDWLDLLSGQRAMVQAMRITFEDAGGHTHHVDQCVAYGGAPPGNVYDRDCQERQERQHPVRRK